MAKYTIELGSMVSAHAHLMATQGDDRILNIGDGSGYEKTFNMPDFVWQSPNEVIDLYARSFIDRHVGADLQENITDKADLNKAIYDGFAGRWYDTFGVMKLGRKTRFTSWFCCASASIAICLSGTKATKSYLLTRPNG